MAALPTTGISTSLVRSTIGAATNDVGTLCTHPNINKWSRWKPVRSNKLTGLTQSDIESAGYGIYRVNEVQFPWQFGYNKPRGVAYSEYYRLGDFRNYNHQAGFPVQIEMISVNNPSFGSQTSAPFRLVPGFTYDFNFRLPLAGEINPTHIDSRANRTKNTAAGGGYGGLSWVSGDYVNSSLKFYRNSNDVFSCPTAGDLMQSLTIENGEVRLQYYKYLGSADGRYEAVHGVWAENEDVRDWFIIDPLDVNYEFNSSSPVWYSSVEDKVYIRIITNNLEPFSVNPVRLTFKYTINGGNEITLQTSSFTMSAGENANRLFEVTMGNRGQNNTYYVRGWLEMYNPYSGTWVELAYNVITTTVNIPIL
jgi:hypothetical protein